MLTEQERIDALVELGPKLDALYATGKLKDHCEQAEALAKEYEARELHIMAAGLRRRAGLVAKLLPNGLTREQSIKVAYELICAHGPIKPQALANKMGMNRYVLDKVVSTLRDSGKIETVHRTHWQVRQSVGQD
jgi:hypothetical protein